MRLKLLPLFTLLTLALTNQLTSLANIDLAQFRRSCIPTPSGLIFYGSNGISRQYPSEFNSTYRDRAGYTLLKVYCTDKSKTGQIKLTNSRIEWNMTTKGDIVIKEPIDGFREKPREFLRVKVDTFRGSRPISIPKTANQLDLDFVKQ